MISAKVLLVSKVEQLETGTTVLTFSADYADGRNKEWAQATPYLNLIMSVKNDVADKFAPTSAYTLMFEPA